MKKMIIGIISLVVLILIIYMLRPSNHSETSPSLKETTLSTGEPSHSNMQSAQKSEFTPSFLSCEKIKSSVKKLEKEFTQPIIPNWDDYLEDGYSIDEITFAIEKIQNRNYAYQWRRSQLITNSPFVKSQNKLAKEFEQLSGEKPPAFMILSPKIPQEGLENFNKLSKHQKSELLSNLQITVDDIAYYIKDKSTPEQDIILMLSYINNYNEITAYNERDPLYLIDNAARFSRPNVFEYLLAKGAKITNDAYLGNTLENSLIALSIHKNNSENATTTKKLISLGLEIRIDKYNTESNGRSFFIGNNNGYMFGEKAIREINELHAIDIQSIPKRPQLSDNKTNHRLNNLLQSKKNNFVKKVIDDDDIFAQEKECNQYLADLRKVATGKHYQNIINEHKKIYTNNDPAMIESLSKIDPSLVDCYNKQQMSFQPMPYGKDIQEMWHLARKKRYPEAFNIANSLQLNKGQRAHFFWQMLKLDIDIFPMLKSNDFIPEEIGFKQLFTVFRKINPKIIEKLQSAGIDTYFGDSAGLSLLNYATAKNDPSLVNYLIDNDYPYKVNDFAQDPLHVALINHTMFQTKNLLNLIKILGPEKRDIDEYHLSRMYVVKLKYPRIYEEIIGLYPMLAVNDETKPPESICIY